LIYELNPTRDDTYWSAFFSWPEKRVTSPSGRVSDAFCVWYEDIENYYLPNRFERLQLEERAGLSAGGLRHQARHSAHRLATLGLCYLIFPARTFWSNPFAV